MSDLTKEKKVKTVIFSTYEDSVLDTKNSYRKVNGNWRKIVSWNAGELPKLARWSVAAPYIIEELERNRREMPISWNLRRCPEVGI